MDCAQKMFDEIPIPDVVQWDVLINGYARCNLENEALRVFQYMFVRRVEPDNFCVTTALMVCAQSGALWQGKWIHEYIKKKSLGFDVFIGTALVDMYAKCGCINMAVEVFEGMPKRNAFSWAAMIRGFAIHGYAKEAINFLERMQVEDRLRPDGVVLLGVLMACTHGGLIEEGRFLLENMEARYGVVARHEHYSCVVDLLCRAGKWDEAITLINKMPMKPLPSVWGAVLSSCRTHKNVELAELAVNELLQLANGDRAEEEAAYVQLSNVYSSVEKDEYACKIRRRFGELGMKKPPGCSMIEVDGMANEFVSGDVSHKNLAQIQEILETIPLF
ncbi:hypothetical protein JCGZ_09711 [Jatropha curcas]|uniref:Pentatricopeptide repeat-containing protein n=1 Tax=Jatropha curcas TaxID=180498 RepID=A0A067LAM6_JATCU|nr:hypothetical protein JCGZ_09711 [Jatropha curcas]